MTRGGKRENEKPIQWMGSSYDGLIEMPEEVQDEVGYALDLAQHGDKAAYAKPMHGGDLANVMEIVVTDGNRTFRGAYTTTFARRSLRSRCLREEIEEWQRDAETRPRPHPWSIPASEGTL